MVPMEQPHTDRQPDPGPLTTRIVGELVPPDGPRTPAHPAPEQLEVTQPYIPAIRDQAPEFAKRLNPEPPTTRTAPPPDLAAGATTSPPAAAPQTAPPRPAPAPQDSPRSPDTATGSAGGRPPKRRSLARRVVRRIIGPDLLRKDPAPKR